MDIYIDLWTGPGGQTMRASGRKQKTENTEGPGARDINVKRQHRYATQVGSYRKEVQERKQGSWRKQAFLTLLAALFGNVR